MTIAIRRVALQRERALLIDFLAKYLTPYSNDRRFDWLYLENPIGQAQVWVAEDTRTGTMLGTSAVFPRRFYVRGKETLGFVLGDFCIHPDFRSLGPAIQLQKACIHEMESSIRTMGYDFPSERMLAVHRRLGVRPGDRLIRLAKPLRMDRKVTEKVRVPLVARSISKLGNRLLRWRDQRRKPSRVQQIDWQTGSCGEEFSTLAVTVSADHEVCLARTADYLNWRYVAHPFQRFEILTSRRDGALDAYLVMKQEGEDARIVDLFGTENPGLLSGIVAHAIELLRSRGVVAVSVPVLASHRWVHLFERLGFVKRESTPVITYPATGGLSGNQDGHEAKWFLMDGDRDS